MNWRDIISELVAAGLSQAEIGQRLGHAQSWVSGVAVGRIKSVRWEEGQKLIAMLAEVRGTNCDHKEAA